MSSENDRSWSVARDADGIAWLTLDKPGGSANVLSQAVLRELDDALAELARNLPRAVIVRSGKKSGFIAGADIKEFTALRSVEEGFTLARAGQKAIGRLESLPCPTIALIQGFALGGGLELALACRYRIGVKDDKLSLGVPEVQLGIHPGFGGTVRLVRILGVRPAMEMMLTGKPVRGEKALAIGLIDALVPAGELDATARRFALDPPRAHRAPFGERILNFAPLRPLIRNALIKQVERKAPRAHYPAPYAMIDLWTRHGAAGEASFEDEARSIANLFLSETARNLVRVFLLQDRLKALAGKPTIELRRVHVIGAGVMGGDIAAWCAVRGLEVTLQDRTEELVAPAMKRAHELFDKRVRGAEEQRAAQARLRADVAGMGIEQADIVIEAIFESLEAKAELYALTEPRMKAGAILASNTSSLLLEPLAAKLADPGRFVGLHFFNPVPQMPLIEIVTGTQTREDVAHNAIALARKLDKLPVPCRSAPGFIVNRVLMPYLHEAMYAAGEGIPLEVIDRAAVDFGMPMGPIELADVVGLDVAMHVGEIVARELGRPAPDLARLRELVAAKKLGKKSGEGFYRWAEAKPQKAPTAGPPPGDLTDRLILSLVNESMAVLREGVARDADLIDAAVIFGTGFAPFRGGPLNYARARGAPAVRSRLLELTERYGERFTPDPGWSDPAA